MKYILILLVSIILLTTGCRTLQPTIQTVHHDSIVYVNHSLHDSIYNYIHDSISIKQKNDTVYKDSYHTIVKYKEVNKNDSTNNKLYYNVTKIIETNKLNTIQKILIWSGCVSILLLSIVTYLKIKKII